MTEPKNGNISMVRARLKEMQIGDFVGYQEGNILNAEIDPEVTAAYYAIEIIPGMEHIASGHLIGRRFGTFQPEMCFEPKVELKDDKWMVVRGKKLDRRCRMVPGYIFVFMWMNDKNYDRIRAIPGIRGFVTRAGELEPLKFADTVIDTLRALEAELAPIEMPAHWQKPAKRKRRKKHGDAGEPSEPEMTFSAIKGWINVGEGQWITTTEALRVLDGKDENQSLAKSLGLAS